MSLKLPFLLVGGGGLVVLGLVTKYLKGEDEQKNTLNANIGRKNSF